MENIKNRKLKISTLDDLNDPFEFLPYSFDNPNSRRLWDKTRQKCFDGKGIICFCRGWQNPVVWSHYAKNHTGLALGFDVPSDVTLEVKYRKSRKKVKNINTLTAKQRERLVEESMSTKYLHWRYEDEVRVFTRCSDQCPITGLFFKDFDFDLSLSEIIIGPRSNLSTSEISKVTDLKDVDIITSRLAFHSYRVVKQ